MYETSAWPTDWTDGLGFFSFSTVFQLYQDTDVLTKIVFFFLFSISVISGQWAGDNDRLCATESCLPLKRSPPEVGLEPGTSKLAGQHLTHRATGASHWLELLALDHGSRV